MTTAILAITMIILLVLGVFLTIAVLLQHGKSHGLGTITGAAENFLGKEKGTRVDRLLARLTTVLGCLFVLVVLLIYILQPNFRNMSVWQSLSDHYGLQTQSYISDKATDEGSEDASDEPSATPSEEPSATPSEEPSSAPTTAA